MNRFFFTGITTPEVNYVYNLILGLITAAQKLQYMELSESMLKTTIEKASMDVFFNLKTGSVLSPGNCTASLARNILCNSFNQDLLSLGINISTWIYEIFSVDSLSASNRDKQCQMLLNVGLDSDKRSIWHDTLLSMSIGEISTKASDMLFQYVITKFYELSLVWKNSILINISAIDESELDFTVEEEKILRYVAGFIPFSLRKRYWSQKHSLRKEILVPIGKAVFSLLDSWTCTSDKKDMNSVSFYDYTKSWTETINRGGLLMVNEEFYVFIRRIERVARSVFNKTLLISYKGEDLRDVLMNKFSANKYIDKSWSSLVRNLESQKLGDTIKIIILRKWIAMRARSFVNAWVQQVKRKSAITGKHVSDRSEPSFRKTLHNKKSAKKSTV